MREAGGQVEDLWEGVGCFWGGSVREEGVWGCAVGEEEAGAAEVEEVEGEGVEVWDGGVWGAEAGRGEEIGCEGAEAGAAGEEAGLLALLGRVGPEERRGVRAGCGDGCELVEAGDGVVEEAGHD